MLKIHLLLVILQTLIAQSLEDEGLLSKFYQTKYRLKDMRANSVSYNKSFFKFYEVRTYKYNRTTAAMNLTLTTIIDAEIKDIELLVVAFKFASNQYRPFPLRYQMNFKAALQKNIAGLKYAAANCGNFPHENDVMVFKKGVRYQLCNIVPDPTHFPPLVPTGRYMEKLAWLYLDEEVSMTDCYAEIYVPIVIRD